jgi:hypothetical protein
MSDFCGFQEGVNQNQIADFLKYFSRWNHF